MNRRSFLDSVAGGAACAALCSCRAPGGGAPAGGAEPPLTIIDTHTHFYDPTRPQGVPWPDTRDAVLYRTTLPEHYLAQPVPRKVTGTIVVEASPWVEDNQWVLDLAAKEPFIAGLVGNLPVGTSEFADLLARFAANPLFRGIRIRDPKPPRGIQDEAVLADLELLAQRKLALDLVGGSEILAQAKFLAERIPDLTIVIDHLAGVRVDGKAPPEDWLAALGALVRHPRVFVKVSGLVEGTGRKHRELPTEQAFYRPVLDAIWHRFGPDRLVYGSNWPVCGHFASLLTVQTIAADYFRAKGRAVEEMVFAGNAASAYRRVERTA
ncbi:MAG TPA: amidohydrolase [Planctomycetes bacterium]|nr:amidohydrolase [Planctomycetota bacterium]